MTARANSFVGKLASGKLASGKRVYVRRLKGDRSDAPIAFAVFADTERDGKMRLVARFHDPTRPSQGRAYCAAGTEHGLSSCHWVRVPEPMSPKEAARWCAHWWSHVVEKVSEVVPLVPVGPP